MSVPRSLKGRFSADRLYAPASVAICGGDTREGARVRANMREAGFKGRIMAVGGDGPDSFASVARLPEPPDLAVLACPPEEGAAALRALGRLGTRAGVAITQIPDLTALAQETGVRLLGGSSFGIAVPRLGLNASVSHIAVPPGRLALLTQSASMARAVLDWAGPNGVGFSHISGVGGNADLGFGVGLDWLSRDPDTGLILLDIRRVKGRRAFISAARAASRLRPVVAIRPGGYLIDPTGEADAVFEAALSRAGVFVVKQFEELLAAAETLSRSKPARGDGLAIVTNAIGPGRLAADAALAAGVKLAVLPAEARSVLAASLPADLVYGLVYAGSSAGTQVAELAAMLGAVKSVGGVLVILAPTGPEDAAAVEAVVAASQIGNLPVLTCVMGETTGAGLRRRLAAAGLPAFATPEQAVQAFGHLLRDRHARIAARELPGSKLLEVAPDHHAVHTVIRAARADERDALTLEETQTVLAAYGIQTGEVHDRERVSVRVHDDPTFGPVIGLAQPGGKTRFGLPPLNLKLAGDLAHAAGLAGGACESAAQLLVRISQLLVDEGAISLVGLDPVWLWEGGAVYGDAAIWLRRPGYASALAIPPYPEHLQEHWKSQGQRFIIRPIRPEDAEAHAAMIRRVPPEDMRYRFFTAMREVSPEQMARLTQIDYEREMAFIAVRESDCATVGVSRLVREMGTPRGEFAIVVEPSAKGLGLAQHLMKRLIDWGRSVGLAEIVGTVLADNHPMLGFVRRLGFAVHGVPDEPDVVEVVLEL
jgi:acyl-CoA synthetase (NDP forming)/RimJ/RimL family protein N-acetyltransferase